MRRLGVGLTAMLLVVCLAVSCGFSAPGTAASGTLELPQPAAGWQDSYLAFLDDCYDIFAALWPDGISGLGFIDLDLDGTPELVVFDQGASATMGVHLFDLSGDWVYCVSSELDSAAGAFTAPWRPPGTSLSASIARTGFWCRRACAPGIWRASRRAAL